MKEKIINLLLPITWLLFFILCLLIFATSSRAATIDEFDQYYPIHQNQDANGDSFYTTAILDYIDQYFDNENNYIISFFSDYYNNGQKTFYVYVLSKEAVGFFGELKTDIRYFQVYSLGSGHTPHAYGLIISDDGSNPYVWSSTSTVFNNLGYSNCYASNFILYTNNNPDTQKLLLLWGDVEEGNQFQGHATPPDPYQDPILAQGSNYTLPREVPEAPTINNYTWITYAPPSVDNSTLENLVESLVDIVKYNASYISTNISNEFNTLVDAIKDLGEYIVKTIQYYVGLVNDNIKNGFSNLYDNIVSLFEPALNGLSYLVEPFDGAEVKAVFTSTNFYNIKTQFTSTFTTFDNAFDISEPDSFVLIFNVQNITPLYNLGVTSPVTVNLGDNFLPIRAALRTFLWILITFGSVFVVEHGLSNWIRGERKT